jgi:hypothetical protein
MTNKDKTSATWSDVKAKLGNFDRVGLLGLVQDLYTASKDNQNFGVVQNQPFLGHRGRTKATGR